MVDGRTHDLLDTALYLRESLTLTYLKPLTPGPSPPLVPLASGVARADLAGGSREPVGPSRPGLGSRTLDSEDLAQAAPGAGQWTSTAHQRLLQTAARPRRR